jgi:hypothetical protein
MLHHNQAHLHRPAPIPSRRIASVRLPLASMIVDPPICLIPPLCGFDSPYTVYAFFVKIAAQRFF